MITNNKSSNNFNCSFNKKSTPYQKTRPLLSLGLFNFQNYFNFKSIWLKTLIVIAVAMAMGITNFFLIEKTGIYTPGINAFYQALARLTYSSLGQNHPYSKTAYSLLFWGLNIFVNLAFAIFCFKKIGKNFTQLTLLYITVLSLTGLFLSLNQDFLGIADFYLFSNPNDAASELTNSNIKITTWPFTHSGKTNSILIVLLYGGLYACINTFITLIIYSVGGVTGGLDWVVFYLYKTKSYSCTKLFFYSGLAIAFISHYLGTYLPYLATKQNEGFNSAVSHVISPTFLATIVAIFTKKALFAIFFPQFKFVKVTVFTNKVAEARNILMENDFPHSFTITESFGSYHLQKQTQLEFICFSIELKDLNGYMREIDPECLITATSLKSLNGYIKVNANFK